MAINKIMCLGAMCEAHIFATILDKRIPGPADGIEAYDFRSVLDLFNGKFFNDILNDKITAVETNPLPHDYDDDIYMRHYDKWMTVHNDFRKKHRKEQFKERIKNFKEYINQAKKDKNLYFIYSISLYDHLLTSKEIDDTIKLLPKFVIDKLIVINGFRTGLPKLFKEKFRCISFNFQIGSESYIDKMWMNIYNN